MNEPSDLPTYEFGSERLRALHKKAKRPDGTYGFEYNGYTYAVKHRSLDPRRPSFLVISRIDYGRLVPTTVREEVLS